MWWLYLIKFIACVIAIFSTALFINSIIASVISNTGFFHPEGTESTAERDAGLRIILAIIMAFSWSVVIVF